MEITNNLNEDIIHSPQWFKDAINDKPSSEIIKSPRGDISYSSWNSKNESHDLIVLIHGTGAHKKWWDPIAPHFRDCANIVAIDLPGMGDSSFRDSYGIKDFGDCIVSVIEEEKNKKNISNIFIVGHSLGGHVAGYVASERKDLISNIIIIDTFIRPPDYDPNQHSSPLRMIKHYSNKTDIIKRFRLMPKQECLNDWYLRYIAEYSVKNDGEGWRWKFDDVMFSSLERLFGYTFSFGCPALFIHGKDSLLTSGSILENIKDIYGGIMSFEEVPGAAHHVPLDKPLELVSMIREHLYKD